jgi:hypothetical protein
MPVYYGNSELGRDYYGSLPQGRIYQGSNLVQNGNDSFSLQYLLLGGGGGGGYANAGGGGGGQFISSSTIIACLSNYNVTIGEGGAGGSGSNGSNGTSSIFDTIVAIGGGGGGFSSNSGSNGASGGGGGGNNGSGGTGSIAFNGGNGLFQSGFDPAGGGGGAGSIGINATANKAGNGGSGSFSSITGTSIEYAGGGGGGLQESSGGTIGFGRGGGGNGGVDGAGPISPVTGSPNTGGGGGGGGGISLGQTVAIGARGGSGALILRYTGSFSASLSSGLTYTIANDGSDKVLSVKSGSGIINFNVFVASNDSDAQAFIDATGISGTDATAINTLVVDLKAAGLWTEMYALWPFVGGTSTTNKYNLINPTQYSASFRGSQTFNSTGWFNNSTDVDNGALLNFNPITQVTNLNDFGVGYYAGNATSTGTLDFGSFIPSAGNSSTYLSADLAGGTGLYISDFYSEGDARIITANGAGGNVIGMWSIQRTADNILKAYRGGTNIATGTNPRTNTPVNISFALGGTTNGNDGVIGQNKDQKYQLLYMSYGLSDAQVASLNTIVTNFQTNVGR